MEEAPRPRPVVVVHGYLASKEMMIPMRARLERAGFEAHIAQLPPLLLGKVEPMAGLLASEIDRILGGFKVQRCDLIGVSLGGLLGLRYLQVFGGPDRVRRFISVGTPFQGSEAARTAKLFIGRISAAAQQLVPGSPFITTLNGEGLPDGLKALSIFATRDRIAPPEVCRLAGAENVEVLGHLPPLTHQGMVISTEVIEQVVDFLSRDIEDENLTHEDLEAV